MSKPPQLEAALQCRATSKRTKQRCKGPAVKGWRVCKFHGAGGGAPRGERHGAYKNGKFTIAARAERAALRKLLKVAKAHVENMTVGRSG